MPLPVQCSQCGKQFQVKDDMAGKRVKCPQCANPVPVAGASAAPAARAAAGAPAAAAIAVQCPGCKAQYKVDAKLAGKQVKCKQCGGAVPVPAATGSARPPAAKVAASAGATAAPMPGTLVDLLEDATVGKLVAPPAVGPGQTLCPHCQTVITMNSAICTSCGMDFRVGKSLKQTEVKPRSPRTQATIDALIALAIVLGTSVGTGAAAGLFVVVWRMTEMVKVGLPWRNMGGSMVFIGGCMVILFYVAMIADAFQEGFPQGFMFLFLPFYSFYFLLTRWKVCRGSFFRILIGALVLACGAVVFIDAPLPKDEEGRPARFRPDDDAMRRPPGHELLAAWTGPWEPRQS